MKFFKTKAIAVVTGSLLAFSASAVIPSEISFTNQTNLALDTSIAGLPGNGITANETKSVGYGIVTMGCSFGNALSDCPIKFTNRATGETVATVNINANTATLVGPPVFYGDYGNKYQVTGWEESPISHITISAIA